MNMKYPVQPQALPSQAHKLKVCLCLAKLQITVNDRLCQKFSFETNKLKQCSSQYLVVIFVYLGSFYDSHSSFIAKKKENLNAGISVIEEVFQNVNCQKFCDYLFINFKFMMFI